nr:TMV resistance protein N-like [Ipomoea batatas]
MPSEPNLTAAQIGNRYTRPCCRSKNHFTRLHRNWSGSDLMHRTLNLGLLLYYYNPIVPPISSPRLRYSFSPQESHSLTLPVPLNRIAHNGHKTEFDEECRSKVLVLSALFVRLRCVALPGLIMRSVGILTPTPPLVMEALKLFLLLEFRPNVAKVKVEVVLLKLLSTRMFIRMGNKKPNGEDNEGFWQPIEYEKVPHYCITYKKQGHLTPSCRSSVRRSGPTIGLEQPPPPAPCGPPLLGSGNGGGGDLSNPSPAPRASPPSGGGNAGSGSGVSKPLSAQNQSALGGGPVAPIPISTCNAFTILQDVHDITLAETTHTQEEVHDTEAQEANTKDFDADLDDHLVKVLGQEGVEDSSAHGDVSSAAPRSLGLQTPVTVPTISPVAQRIELVLVAKRTRRTQSASEQSNVAGFYCEASDDDSDSSLAGRVATFESTGCYKESARGHGSSHKTSQVPFGGRITRSQVHKK